MGKNPKRQTTNSGSGSGQDELHAAARSGDLVKVQLICSTNPLAVNSRDQHSRTPLHLAAWAGQSKVVDFLCKNKADVGAAAMDDMGAIHFAAQKGHVEVVRTLLSYGISVKACNRKGMTPLHYAVQGSHVDLVKYLVKKGANPSTKNKAGKSPLDLSTTEEILSLLQSASESKQGDKTGDLKAEKAERESTAVEKEEVSNVDVTMPIDQDDVDKKDVSAKRKGEDVAKENVSEPKKAKVTLNHLVASDDALEDEENV